MRFPRVCIEKMPYNCSLPFFHGFIHTPVCLFLTAKELNLFCTSSYKSFFIPLVIIALLCKMGSPKSSPILEDHSEIHTQNSNPSLIRALQFGTRDTHCVRRKLLTWHFACPACFFFSFQK